MAPLFLPPFDVCDGEFDGKCFDMTSTRLLDSDIKHDATDCRVAFEQGRLALRE